MKLSQAEIAKYREQILADEGVNWPEPGSVWKSRDGYTVRVTQLSRPEDLVHMENAKVGGMKMCFTRRAFWEWFEKVPS